MRGNFETSQLKSEPLYGDRLCTGGDSELEFEAQLLEQRLKQQQLESEEDRLWLAEEEVHLKKRLSIANSLSDTDSIGDREGSLATPPSSWCGDSLDRQKLIKERTIVVKKMEPTPTANLDRTNDKVYLCTTCVVKSVMALSQGVQQSKASQYLELVQSVGLELRQLLLSVDSLVSVIPSSLHREIELAHQVLSKDMGELVSAMKLAQSNSNTTLDRNYRKAMLSAAHVLAMDAKNLLDVIDSIRMRFPEVDALFKNPLESDGESLQAPETQSTSETKESVVQEPKAEPISHDPDIPSSSKLGKSCTTSIHLAT